ncbi:hypothetical protein Ancab_018903 [Ancistrocladus abbreviatus]
MAKSSLVSLSFCCLVVFSSCLVGSDAQGRRPRQAFEHCRFDRINVLEPTRGIRAEAGITEVWDASEEQFRCAGMTFIRRTIEPGGLLLPMNTQQQCATMSIINFAVGRALDGVLLPGCAETYRSIPESRREAEGRRLFDQHQKITRLSQGDVIAFPSGVAHWTYNDGDEPVVIVVLLDTSNSANQLDHDFPKRFYLAGSPQQPEHGVGYHDVRRSGNVFSGFDPELLSQAFGHVDYEIIEKLQCPEDIRGNIVRVGRLSIARPPRSREFESEQQEGSRRESEREREGEWRGRRESESEQERERQRKIKEQERREREGRGRREWEEPGRRERESECRRCSERGQRERYRQEYCAGGRCGNIFEAGDSEVEGNICTARLTANIDQPSRADIYNPQAGRLTILNSYKLPILRHLDLSVTKGVLYRNALLAPHWNLDAHSMIYATRGRCQIQIVNDRGQCVFNGVLSAGQVVTVPQNFAVILKAREEGFEWLAFRTSHNPNSEYLAGPGSALSGMPREVIGRAYGLSDRQVGQLKHATQQARLIAPRPYQSPRSDIATQVLEALL